jgi:hypothetical protein
MHWSTMLSKSFFAVLLMLLACAQTARAAASLIKSPPPSKSSKDTASPYPPEYDTVATSFGEPLAMLPPPSSPEPTPLTDSGTVATSTDKPAGKPGDAAKSPATSPLPQSPEPTPPKDTGTVATSNDNLSPTDCGGRCKPCCPNEKCNAGYLCNSQSKLCEPERGQEGVPGPPDCGFEGVKCCPEVRPPSSSLCPGTGPPDKGDGAPPGTKCDAGLMCESGKCRRPTPPPPPEGCGARCEVCCPNEKCNASYLCNSQSKLCEPERGQEGVPGPPDCGFEGIKCCPEVRPPSSSLCTGTGPPDKGDGAPPGTKCDAGLMCESGKCMRPTPPPPPEECGARCEVCCADRKCEPPLKCDDRNDRCEPGLEAPPDPKRCGEIGEPCCSGRPVRVLCPDGRAPLVCTPGGPGGGPNCGPGPIGPKPLPEGGDNLSSCSGSLECIDGTCDKPPTPPAECGSVGAICCEEGDQASCDAGLECGKGGKCVTPDTSCGKSGQQCCIDTNGFQVCKGKNLVCSKGRCLPKSKVCGQLGCKCCRGRRCSGGLTCSKRNTCVVCETGCFGR